MKHFATITATDDDSQKVTVEVAFTTNNDLTADEQELVVRRAARSIAAVLSGLPYTDFGAENTSVKMSSKR